MIKVEPQFVYDENDKKVGVILSIEDFEHLLDELEDYQDYQFLVKRSGKKEKLYTLEQIQKDIEERSKK